VGQPLIEVAPEFETVIQEISGGRPNAEVEIDVMRERRDAAPALPRRRPVPPTPWS
jgi:nitrogen fixation/metabolism regulation signal transduction histidine kinase